jgi:hypothetical protein
VVSPGGRSAVGGLVGDAEKTFGIRFDRSRCERGVTSMPRRWRNDRNGSARLARAAAVRTRGVASWTAVPRNDPYVPKKKPDWPTGFAPAPSRSQREMPTDTPRPVSVWKMGSPAGNAPASAVQKTAASLQCFGEWGIPGVWKGSPAWIRTTISRINNPVDYHYPTGE